LKDEHVIFISRNHGRRGREVREHFFQIRAQRSEKFGQNGGKFRLKSKKYIVKNTGQRESVYTVQS